LLGFLIFWGFLVLLCCMCVPLLLETPGDNPEHREDIEVIREILHQIDPADGWDWRRG